MTDSDSALREIREWMWYEFRVDARLRVVSGEPTLQSLMMDSAGYQICRDDGLRWLSKLQRGRRSKSANVPQVG